MGAEQLTKEFLIERYINQFKSQKEIAKEIGIQNKNSVRKYLQKYEIEIRKHTKSQSYIEAQKARRLIGDISKRYWHSLQYQAKKRKIEFNISPEYIWNLYLRQNKKCVISGVELQFNGCCDDPTTQTASLDRINNNTGYLEGNVQWVHKIVNKIKMDLEYDELLKWCRRIAKYNDRCTVHSF